jgi:hypothetical protein
VSNPAYLRSLSLQTFFLACLLASTHAFGDQIISQHNYSLYKGNILFGKSSYILSKKDSIYTFKIKSSSDGIFKMKKDERVELSTYKINSDHIKPISYIYSRKRKDKKDYLITNFETNRSANTVDNGERKEHMTTTDSLDRLSVQIAFQEGMRKGIFESSYNIIDKGRLRKYIYKIHSDDVIDTIFGKTNTIIIKRIIENNKRSTLTWYAVDYDFTPVRIEQYRKNSLKFTVYLEKVVK